MKRIPQMLATLLILALLNISYINLALAITNPSPGIRPVTPVKTSAPEPSGPQDTDPCAPKVTKKCIENDLDDAKADLVAFLGTDPNSIGNQLIEKTGLDPLGDFEDAKNELNALSDTDFESNASQYNKIHKKAQKRKHQMAAILGNKSLMARIHNPSPLKFRVVVGNTGAAQAGSDKVIFKSATSAGSPAPSKTSALRGEFSKGLGTISVTVMPEYDKTCSPGPGIPNGADDLWISKAVTHAAEFAKELIPDDTAAVVPQVVAVTLWGAAKAVEIVLESTHVVYLECNNAKREWEVDQKFETIQGSFSTVTTNINDHTDSEVTGLKTAVNNAKNDIVVNDNTNKTELTTHVTNKAGDIITKISESGGKTTDAVNSSTTTITNNISNSFTTLNTNVTNSKTELNTSINNSKTEINTNINNSKTEINKTVNDNRTLIINNANTNASNSLRLMIEADLATPDSATPLAIFETPTAKGGYLELVRAIVFETIRNLTGATVAQANATLASIDNLIATGKYKPAYAALRKAYKTAAN
jgi:hypothetical protein